MRKKLARFNVGGQIGSAIGAGATSFIPGVGPLIGGTVGGFLGDVIGGGPQKRRREAERLRELSTPRTVGYATQGYRLGGNLPVTSPIGPDAERYVGPSHEAGGIPVDESGRPTSVNNAVAEVEGGETRQGDYIFSDELMVPNTEMTFAQAHEMLLSEGAGEEEIQQLMQLQEQIRQEQGITDAPTMQTGGRIAPSYSTVGGSRYSPPGSTRYIPKSPTPNSFYKSPNYQRMEAGKLGRSIGRFAGRAAGGAGVLLDLATPSPAYAPTPPARSQAEWDKIIDGSHGVLMSQRGPDIMAGHRAGVSYLTDTASTPQRTQSQAPTTPATSATPTTPVTPASTTTPRRTSRPERSINRATMSNPRLMNPEVNTPEARSVQSAQREGITYNAPEEISRRTSLGDIADVAGYVVPSLTRLGTAALAPRPERTPRTPTRRVATNSPVFTDARRRQASAFRMNPTQGSHAIYSAGVNDLASREAQFRSEQERVNTQLASRADAINTQARMRDADARAQDTAARMRLVSEAIEYPITAYRADRRGREQQAANVIMSASRISNSTDRRNAIVEGLKAIGYSDEEIAERIRQMKFGGKLKKRR